MEAHSEEPQSQKEVGVGMDPITIRQYHEKTFKRTNS